MLLAHIRDIAYKRGSKLLIRARDSEGIDTIKSLEFTFGFVMIIHALSNFCDRPLGAFHALDFDSR